MKLQDRVAKCYCGKTEPSSADLAFFEYRGEGSNRAAETCGHCKYSIVAHERACREPEQRHLDKFRDHEFRPYGAYDHDIFYCGCRGWD